MALTEERETQAESREENVGLIEEIQGVVIEAVFPDKLPEINHAIRVRRPETARSEEEEDIALHGLQLLEQLKPVAQQARHQELLADGLLAGPPEPLAQAWVGQWSQGIDYPVTLAKGKLPPLPTVTLPPLPTVTLPPLPTVTLPPLPTVTLPPLPTVTLPPLPTLTVLPTITVIPAIDTDGDGCQDVREIGLMHQTGGQRNPQCYS